MSSRLFRCSVNQLEIELKDAGRKLYHLPSSTKEIIKILVKTEEILSRVQQTPPKSTKYAMHPVIKALIANKLARHPDLDVNISVTCCICDVFRIMAPDSPYKDKQMKEFFELVVMTFEKLSSASGGCYTKMIKVLETLCSGKLSVMMFHLQLDGLIARLFTQFLAVAESNSSAVVSNMEKIMTMIVEEHEELPSELVNLLTMSVKKDNQIALPVSSALGKKALNYRVTMTGRRCLHSQSDPLTPSKSVTEVNGKRKRNSIPWRKQAQSVEHGGNLVGSRIKVWWPKDDSYYEGIVKSFECSKKKHKVLYDDGDEEFLDLRRQKWELVENVSPVQSAEHGENLVGSKIRVWWPADKMYYEGAVASFDRRKKKHKVLYDDGDVDVLDLNQRRWMLSENVSAIPDSSLGRSLRIKVCSARSAITSIHGYRVKKSVAPTLEAIFKKHGDIASDCLFKTASVRESMLEAICEVCRRVQTNDVTSIISEREKIEGQVSAAEASKINVSWLRPHLEAIYKMAEANKKYSLLMKMKQSTSLVTRAADKDLEETRINLLAAQERFEKAERCVEVLNLVKKKLNESILETEAEEDLRVKQPIF